MSYPPSIRALKSPEELDPLFETSRERPVLLFKHSVHCGTSFFALEQLLDHVESEGAGDVTYALVEIQPHRDVSNAIAERTGVRHQSPQAILLDGGEVAWTATHYGITKEALDRVVSANGG